MSDPAIDFKEFRTTKVVLFVYDPIIRRHTAAALKHLGFENVTDHDVPRNYFEALSRLAPIVAGNNDLIIHNLPQKPRTSPRKDEVDPVFEQMDAAYADLKANLAKRQADPLARLSKTVPILEVGDYLREKLVDVLFRYRVPAAFFMSAVESTNHLSGDRKTKQLRDNFHIHFRELVDYLTRYFRDKDELVALAKEKLSEKDLTERKKKYDGLVVAAKGFKEKGDFESAIALLRQAIAVFPKDIEAFLESGRLYVRRREYGRALSRYAQAEELFQDAPEPNKEIAGMRLTQVKERVEAGESPDSPEIKALLEEAVTNYEESHRRSVEMVKKHHGDPDFAQPVAVGHEILKWNVAEFLGPKHPVVRRLLDVAQKSTEGLSQLKVEDLTTSQCLALGLQALEKGDLPMASMYYFHALKDKERFTEVCTEINYMGIRLRLQGRVDDALRIYHRLLKFNPHNKGSVYWNMAIAYAYKQDHLNAAGFVVRSLYVDPVLGGQDEFYQSLTPQLLPILIRLMRALRLIVSQSRKIGPDPQLAKLYQAQDLMIRRINENKKGEALQWFMKLVRHPARFTQKPEFHADGVVAAFLKDIGEAMRKSGDPKHAPYIRTIGAWLKWVEDHPVQPKLGRFLTLSRQAIQAMEIQGDQHLAVFYFGQSLLVLPDGYFDRPDFFSRESLPAMAKEVARKFKNVDPQKFPKFKTGPGAGVTAGPRKAKRG